MKKRVSIVTFGCKVNQYESACISTDFMQKNYELVPFPEQADVYIINTCTVTSRTDYKSRNAIRRALKQKKDKSHVRIIVTGCYSQLNKEKIMKMGDIDLIVDNNNKDQIINFLEQDDAGSLAEPQEKFMEDTSRFIGFTEQQTDSFFERSRAFIKIQDGCDYFCAFCTVPFARGKPRSRKPEDVLAQISHLVTKGYQEFVMTGINLGLYGKDFADKKHKTGYTGRDLIDLAQLLFEIEKIKGVKLIRLSSLEPQLFTPSIMEYIKNSKKLCPHLHIPVQSGSNTILQAMNRPYKREQYRQIIEEITYYLPDIALGSDIIIGFPGETEELFRETFTFIEQLPLTYLHIFPYSKRPATKAADMPDMPAQSVVKERCTNLASLMVEKKNQYMDYLVRKSVALSGILERKKGNYWTALSDHYIRLYYEDREMKNTTAVPSKTEPLSSAEHSEISVRSKGDFVSGIAERQLFDGLEVLDND